MTDVLREFVAENLWVYEKPKANMRIVCVKTYMSPGGKNKYREKQVFKICDTMGIYAMVLQENEYKNSRQAERAKVTNGVRYDVLRRDNFTCCICGFSQGDGVRLHVDHIVPVARGGKSELENLQTLCERCNSGKGAKC